MAINRRNLLGPLESLPYVQLKRFLQEYINFKYSGLLAAADFLDQDALLHKGIFLRIAFRNE